MTRSHCERPASVNRRTLIFCGQSNGHSGACCGRKTLGADRHPLKSLPKRFELDLRQWLTMRLAHVRFNGAEYGFLRDFARLAGLPDRGHAVRDHPLNEWTARVNRRTFPFGNGKATRRVDTGAGHRRPLDLAQWNGRPQFLRGLGPFLIQATY